ncbi:MAG: glycoside hydrolase family 99-like domain-containing protein [Clostridia bacterium]|nr:glycoside hydrolase family 99-like domain-containing protein [Clostridia bacterium]
MKEFDIAAYIWPAYTGKEKRAWQFWPEKIGEWQTVKTVVKKFEGNEWPRKPLWGYQDEADPAVMEWQIEEAVKHGVNVFIYDWYWYDNRPFLENCLNDGFLQAKNRDKMKFYLMWANHSATTMWDKRLADIDDLIDIWSGNVDRKTFEVIVARLIEKYFKQPNYYKINGCPVFSIYEISNFINGLGGFEQAIDAIRYFRNEVKAAGFPDLHLQMILRKKQFLNISGVDGEQTLSNDEVIRAFDVNSLTHYQFAHFVKVNEGYSTLLENLKKEMDKISSDYSLPYYPHVSVGWDNNPRTEKIMPYVATENDPENFRLALELVKDYSEKHNEVPLITINSWNEWTETSYLQPDDKYGYGYLNAVKEVFKK